MEEILNALKLSNELISLYRGDIPIIDEKSIFQFYINEDKTDSLPFPPFLIPFMYSYDADHYHIGIIRHWFTDRAMSFGDMTDGRAFQTIEISRNDKQLFSTLLFNEFVNNEDCIVTARLLKCTQLMGLKDDINFAEFKKLNNDYFQNPECKIPALLDNSPLSCISDNIRYNGVFPSNDSIIIPENVPNSCYFEISQKEWIGYGAEKKGFSFFRKEPKYQPIENIPEWLRPDTDKKDLFEKYFEEKELDKAWLTINGPGFNPIEVGERLQRLKEFSNEKAYHLWADFWCERYGEMDSFIFL